MTIKFIQLALSVSTIAMINNSHASDYVNPPFNPQYQETPFFEEVEVISTNPDSPVIPVDKQNTSYGTNNDYQTNVFDWTNVKWPWVSYTASSNPVIEPPLVSPFYLDQLNRYPFSSSQYSSGILPDMQPDGGWELVKNNMGFYMLKGGNSNEVFPQKTYGVPHIMLYNKKTAKLRVIALYDAPTSLYHSVAIELSHNGQNNRVATNLFASYGGSPLDRTPSTLKAVAIAPLIANEDKQWIFADFDLGYDPCTSCYESVLTLKVTPITNGDISLTGRSTANAVPVRDSQGMIDSNYLTSYFSESGTDDNVGALTFKSYDALYNEFKDHEDFATAVHSEVDWSSSSESAKAIAKTSKALSTVASSSPEPISKAVLSTLSGIFDFANFSKPAKLEGFEVPPPMPSVIVGEMALRGSVTFEGNIDATHIATPGSLNAKDAPEFSPTGSYPTFNEELGIFSMVTLPRIVVDSFGSSIEDSGFRCISTRSWDGAPLGCASRKLEGQPYYTINPVSGISPSDIDVYVALERTADSYRKKTNTPPHVETGYDLRYLSNFVRIEDISQLAGARDLRDVAASGVNYNLKVVVASKGIIGETPDQAISNPENSQLLSFYTYPLKISKDLVRWSDFRVISKPAPSGTNRPIPFKPMYVTSKSVKETMCVDGRYGAAN